MRSYVISIITVSVISGLLSAMLPNNNGVKKHLNFITGLICTFILLSPVVSIAKNATILTNSIENAINSLDLDDTINKSNSIVIESGSEQISKGVKNAIVSKYKFKEENVIVEIVINDSKIEQITLDSLTVTLLNEATWTDSQEVKEYVEGLVGCPVKISKR